MLRLDLMFQGTYNSEFYRAIRKVLNDQVVLERPAAQWEGSEYASLWCSREDNGVVRKAQFIR